MENVRNVVPVSAVEKVVRGVGVKVVYGETPSRKDKVRLYQ